MGSADEIIPIEVVSEVSALELRDIYTRAGNQTASATNIVSVIDLILDRIANEEATTTELLALISALRDAIVVNANEIQTLHRLNGLLIFELQEQGITIENEELLEQLNYI